MIMVTWDIQDAWNENGMYHFGNNTFLPFFENTTCRFQKEAILSDFLLFNQAQLVVNFQKSPLRLISVFMTSRDLVVHSTFRELRSGASGHKTSKFASLS